MSSANDNGRKPHNYRNEMTPEQREEFDRKERLDALEAKQKAVDEAGKAQKRFDDHSPIFRDNGNGQGQGQSQQSEPTSVTSDNDDDDELAAIRLRKSDIDFMFEIMMRESKYDELSIRQTVHGFNSAFTKLPMPHVSTSQKSGAGKSYIVNHIAEFYPKKYQITLAAASDKALFHLDGEIIVMKDEETGEYDLLSDITNRLEAELEECDNDIRSQQQLKKENRNNDLIKDRKRRIKDIQTEIKDLERSAQKLIDFDNKIITVQDTPSQQFFNLLMTILSQDSKRDQQYAFTDKTSNGKLFTSRNRIRGMPVIMTTQVIDDTDNARFDEKIRRFIHISPDTSKAKIKEANRLSGLRLGYLPKEYDNLVVSREDKERAKDIVKIIIAKLKQHKKYLEAKESGVKVPFALALMMSLPVEEGEVWKMTVGERTMKYLSMVTKLNMDSRPKLIDTETRAFYPISTFEDLKETLELMERGASRVRPYLQQWFDIKFMKCYRELANNPDRFEDNSAVFKENVIGLTTEDLHEETNESIDQIRKRFLDPLINLGLIEKAISAKNNKVNIYFPANSNNNDNNKSKNKNKKIVVSDPSIYPSRNFIVDSLVKVVRYDDGHPSKNENNFSYELVDEEGRTITPEDLADRYFANPEEYFEKDF